MLPELYHAHHLRHMEDLPFWLGLATRTDDPVLELGCGTGRMLIPLVQAGHRCVGLDRDLAKLKFLHTSLARLMPADLALIAADMSCFTLAKQFPLIILPCNTYSTLDAEQRRACLERIRQHLKPGGIFSVSLPNPALLAHLPARSDIQFEEEFILPQSGNPVQVSSAWRKTRKTFTVVWVYDHLFPNGTVERITIETIHHLVSVQDYLGELQEARLSMSSLYGDFDRSPYTADSPNLIILASR